MFSFLGSLPNVACRGVKRKTCVLFQSVKKKLTWARRQIHLPRSESMEKLYASARACYQPHVTSSKDARLHSQQCTCSLTYPRQPLSPTPLLMAPILADAHIIEEPTLLRLCIARQIVCFPAHRIVVNFKFLGRHIQLPIDQVQKVVLQSI